MWKADFFKIMHKPQISLSHGIAVYAYILSLLIFVKCSGIVSYFLGIAISVKLPEASVTCSFIGLHLHPVHLNISVNEP